MALQDPVAVYNASSNVEAQLLRDRLVNAGIEAFAVEDNSPAGMYSLGTIAEIHKPQVWVSRSDVDRARPVIEGFEDAAEDHTEKPAELFCYECGEPVKHGDTRCGSCGHALEWTDDEPDEPDAEDEGVLENLRAAKKPLALFFLAPFMAYACLLVAALLIALYFLLFR
jgi:hypothetical protein